jgi:hypothetical protein
MTRTATIIKYKCRYAEAEPVLMLDPMLIVKIRLKRPRNAITKECTVKIMLNAIPLLSLPFCSLIL